METIKKELADGWSLVAHPGYTVYSNYKSFVVMTSEDDEMGLKFSVNSENISIDSMGWGTKIEVSRDNKTISITTDPTYNEDEE